MPSTSATMQPLARAYSPVPWKPHPYQIKSVEFLLGHGSAGLLLDPGLGKTSATLAAISILKREGMLNRTLVIAPLRVCYSVWPEEVKKWKDFGHLRVEILHGKYKDQAVFSDADIFVINPEGLDWLFSGDNFANLGVDTLVVDESSKFKHTNTKRFKTLKPYLTKFKRRWILTGTPMPNGYMDLFGQMYILDLGKSLGRYVTHFRFNYFYPLDRNGWEWGLKPDSERRLQEAIRPYTLRLDADDYLKLPRLIDSPIRLELPPKARKIYDELEDEMFTVLEGEKTVTAVSAAAVSGKCRQVCSGGIYYHHEVDETDPLTLLRARREAVHVHDVKTEALVDLVAELQGAPLLVAYDFVHDLDRLRKAFGADVPVIGGGTTPKKSKIIEDAWNAGKLPMLLGHPAAMGHGLNLQGCNCRHIAWYSLTWDLELYKQFIDRVRRQGNVSDCVMVYPFIMRETVEEVVWRALRKKSHTQKAMLDALRDYKEGGCND